MTDLDVIKWHHTEQAKDEQFMLGSDVDPDQYKAYLEGQRVGVKRAMAYLRQQGILKPILIEGVNHWKFQ